MSVAAPNIWYVAHYAGGPGIGRHSRGWYLARNWQAQGARVTVIAANRHHMLDQDQPAGFREVQGVDYHFLQTPAYRNNGLMRVVNMFAFTAAFRARQSELMRMHGRPDVIIASSPHPFCFLPTHRLARSLGAKSIFEVRDLWPASMIEILNMSPWHPMTKLIEMIERYAYANADAVVSLLPKTEGYMRSRGLTGNRWHHVPNGIVHDETSERPAGSPLFEQIDRWHTEGHAIVCYTGALGVPNNVDRLIDAMTLLKRKTAPVRALIVGRGDMEHELRARVTALGLEDHMRFFGQVPKAVARAVQQHADIGFIALKPSSVFRFGISPNKMFDYMMSSLPIASAIDAGNDIVAEVGCGVSVPQGSASDIADAIVKLASMTPAERREMGRLGRKFVEQHHDYQSLARNYLNVILS